ncbi:tetratricopeptide repeat protein [Granulicella sp. 5B5]|uniref:tetratricopeptide repeat protein n=1 Tax=Granulicella sp. 5B5 TaxID=1617967 RepID=UPI0015F5E4BA|nr:tetratricopeptide repeat protein [Granulicella sp. 5B5]QMV18622.1 tetratricopeptide repeat protein [Granulicella sp. 5B5]
MSAVAVCLLSCSLMRAQSAAGATSADSLDAKTVRHSIDMGHADLALKQIATLRAGHGVMAGLNRLEGLAEYQLGDLHAADKAFAAALFEDPHDVESSQMRGLTLFRLGRPADAIPLLEAAGKQGALGKADPNYILALCYMDTRRYDDARHAFAAQYGFAPDGAAAYLIAARMLLRREYLPVSQSFAQKALAINPNLPLAHELLGEIALAGDHLDEAIAELEKEKVNNPLEPSVYAGLGEAYNRAAKYDDAQRNLQASILLEPNATGPYISLGKTMLKKGDAVAALTYLQHAEQLDPQNFRTHSLLGQAYRAMGRVEDAARETEKAEKIQQASEPRIDTQH